MEASGAARICEGSVEMRKLTYTIFVRTGDSRTFQTVNNRITEKFGKRYPIKKEECLGHIQKKDGKCFMHVRTCYVREELADGKSVGGKRHLTEDKNDSFQR